MSAVVSFRERIQAILDSRPDPLPSFRPKAPETIKERHRFKANYTFRNPPEPGLYWIELWNGKHLRTEHPASLHPRTLRKYRKALRETLLTSTRYQMYLVIRSKANTQ